MVDPRGTTGRYLVQNAKEVEVASIIYVAFEETNAVCAYSRPSFLIELIPETTSSFVLQ
jgi:hypothetical protein